MSAQVQTNGGGNEAETINTNIVTLTRFLTEEQVKIKEATGDFTYVLLFNIFTATLLAHGLIMLTPRPACCATPCSSPSSQSPTTSEEQPS